MPALGGCDDATSQRGDPDNHASTTAPQQVVSEPKGDATSRTPGESQLWSRVQESVRACGSLRLHHRVRGLVRIDRLGVGDRDPAPAD